MRVRRSVAGLCLAVAGLGLSSCGSVAERSESIDPSSFAVHSDAQALADVGQPPSAAGTASAPSTSPDEILDFDAPLVALASGPEESDLAGTAFHFHSEPTPADSKLDRLSVDELLAELDRRLAAKGQDLSAKGRTSREKLADLEQKLIALTFRRDPDAALLATQALEALESGDDLAIESKLITAALLARHGQYADRDTLLAEVYEELYDTPYEPRQTLNIALPSTSPDTEHADAPDEASPVIEESDAAPKESEGFELRSVCFASEIDGLGAYTERAKPTFQAGEVGLIYGEFARFFEEIQEVDGRLTYVSHLRASMKLLDEKGQVFDTGSIHDGEVRSDTFHGRLNFWARCKFPADAPPGKYTVVIEASDLRGKETAEARLPAVILPPE